MKTKVKSKLEELRADYAQVKGQPFVHFYCPILFEDEDVPLCKAHIINERFRNSSRAWTVQRRDVDSFYGSKFEDDFLAIKYHIENLSPDKVLADKKLSRKYRPEILVDDEPVDYFVAQGDIPEHFTNVEFNYDGQPIRLGLKMSPEDVSTVVEQKCELEVSKDVRIPSLVSLIKSAHLTLFELVGYRYAFSAGGYFVGQDILGKFFRDNHDKSRSTVLENAPRFFSEFVHMVRPVELCALDLQGTITDRQMLICRGSRGVWALIVFIRTSSKLHSVMIPVFDQPDAVATFLSFLKNKNDSIEVMPCCYEQGQWEIRKELFRLIWPKKGILSP
jgi:hypothetical protein